MLAGLRACGLAGLRARGPVARKVKGAFSENLHPMEAGAETDSVSEVPQSQAAAWSMPGQGSKGTTETRGDLSMRQHGGPRARCLETAPGSFRGPATGKLLFHRLPQVLVGVYGSVPDAHFIVQVGPCRAPR